MSVDYQHVLGQITLAILYLYHVYLNNLFLGINTVFMTPIYFLKPWKIYI